MKTIRQILAITVLAAGCLSTSCKKGGGVEEIVLEPTPVYITADSFKNSSWKGTQTLSTTSILVVNNTEMTFSYYVKSTLAKNTDEMLDLVKVKITPYTYDESSGKFSGTGDDKLAYEGQVISATSLKITIPNSETITMYKQ